MTDAIDLIRTRLSSLPESCKRIGTFILADPQRVTGMTLRELSRETGAAEGSIINFASRMGYDGYTALKLAIARSFAKGETLKYESADISDSAREVMRKTRDNTVDALRATCESVTDEELLCAVSLLMGAKKRIEVYGIGSSAMIMSGCITTALAIPIR